MKKIVGLFLSLLMMLSLCMVNVVASPNNFTLNFPIDYVHYSHPNNQTNFWGIILTDEVYIIDEDGNHIDVTGLEFEYTLVSDNSWGLVQTGTGIVGEQIGVEESYFEGNIYIKMYYEGEVLTTSGWATWMTWPPR